MKSFEYSEDIETQSNGLCEDGFWTDGLAADATIKVITERAETTIMKLDPEAFNTMTQNLGHLLEKYEYEINVFSVEPKTQIEYAAATEHYAKCRAIKASSIVLHAHANYQPSDKTYFTLTTGQTEAANDEGIAKHIPSAIKAIILGAPTGERTRKKRRNTL